MIPGGFFVWVRGALAAPRITLFCAAGILLIHGWLGAAPESLLYDRDLVRAGEVWRLVTGHLVHADSGHLLWNLAAFIGLGLLYERLAAPRWPAYLLTLLAGMAAVDAWLWWCEPALPVYCGLSGMLNALFVVVAVALWRASGHPLALLLVAGDLAKIALEAHLGGALLPTSTWVSVPGAHFAGLLAGLLLSGPASVPLRISTEAKTR